MLGAADGDWLVAVTPVLVTVTTTPSTTIGFGAVPVTGSGADPVAIPVAISASTAGSTGVPATGGKLIFTTTDPQSNCMSSVDPSIVWDGVSAAASATILALTTVSSAAL